MVPLIRGKKKAKLKKVSQFFQLNVRKNVKANNNGKLKRKKMIQPL